MDRTAKRKGVYSYVVGGKVVGTQNIEFDDEIPNTCEKWWKDTYTKENGAFWFKSSDLRK